MLAGAACIKNMFMIISELYKMEELFLFFGLPFLKNGINVKSTLNLKLK